MKRTYPVGVLFSTSGPYSLLGRDALDGALMALAEVNEEAAGAVELIPLAGDPGGMADRYPAICDQLAHAGARHIVGGITSWSRKEMIPVADRRNALLWYPCPYEGYESSDRVIYVGACPNQHIVPLFSHVMPRYGTNAFLAGSNYIWGWETNRIAIKLIEDGNGSIVGERYLPLGSTDVNRIVQEIADTRPDFILNTLIGPSSYAFFKAYARLGKLDRRFLPARRPIVSCNLAELELAEIGNAGIGNLSTAVYFEGIDTAANRDFLKRVQARYGADRRVSAFFACSYMAMRMVGEGIRAVGSDEPEQIVSYVCARGFPSPMGPLRISARTRHTSFAPLLASIGTDRRFDLIAPGPANTIDPDPYLADYRPALPAGAGPRSGGTHLKVVRS